MRSTVQPDPKSGFTIDFSRYLIPEAPNVVPKLMEPGPKKRVAANSWMEDNVLVAAAVEAVEEDRSLHWSPLYRVNGEHMG